MSLFLFGVCKPPVMNVTENQKSEQKSLDGDISKH